MSERIAMLEQRVRELEAECAGLMAIALMVLGREREDDPEAWADAYEAASIRWPELEFQEIHRAGRGIIAAALRQGGRPPPTRG